MTILNKNTSALTRIYIDDIAGQYDDTNNRDMASTMLDYHDGNDVEHIKIKMAERYATEITKTKSSTGAISYNQAKTKAAQVAAINNNLFEVVTRGMTRKITTNTATLSENSIFEYLSNGTVDDDFKADLEQSRSDGSFNLMFSRLDEISVIDGSAVMLLQVNNGEFQYQPITPDKVWIVFGKELETNEEILPVNRLKIEHAQCVVIQMDTDQYAAYFGRSDMYETGRFVQYTASSWSAIPDVNGTSTGTEDYYIGEEIYNPLTYLQDSTGDYTTPEYPIITWQGTTQGIGKELLPVSIGLYETSKEIDLSSSRTAMSANKAARGAWFFTNEGGVSPNQPDSLDEGISKLEAGQSVLVLSVPAANIEQANKINNSSAQYLADSWSVPSYLVSVDTNAIMPSGAALMELNRPSVKFQQMRKDINDSQMDRLFNLEKSLASIETGQPVGEGIKQVWTLKEADIYKTELEVLTDLEKRNSLGLTDEADMLVELDGITREQAVEKLDTLEVVAVANTTGNRLGL